MSQITDLIAAYTQGALDFPTLRQSIRNVTPAPIPPSTPWIQDDDPPVEGTALEVLAAAFTFDLTPDEYHQILLSLHGQPIPISMPVQTEDAGLGMQQPIALHAQHRQKDHGNRYSVDHLLSVKVTRTYPGFYKVTASDGRTGEIKHIEQNAGYRQGGWFVTYPGETYPDDVYPTLAEAKEALEYWAADEGTVEKRIALSADTPPPPPSPTGTVSIVKSDPRKNLVFGWANVAFTPDGQVEDHQGHLIDLDDLENAAYQFVVKYRLTGDMHGGDGFGELVESLVVTEDKIEKAGFPPSMLGHWWVGFRVPPEHQKRVDAGERMMFSIQGKAHLEPVVEDVTKHASPVHPGTGTGQEAHDPKGGGGSTPKNLTWEERKKRLDAYSTIEVGRWLPNEGPLYPIHKIEGTIYPYELDRGDPWRDLLGVVKTHRKDPFDRSDFVAACPVPGCEAEFIVVATRDRDKYTEFVGEHGEVREDLLMFNHHQKEHLRVKSGGVLIEERKRSKPFRTIQLPRTFWDDHADRSDFSPGDVKRRTSRYVLVELSEEEWDDLYSDAEYYADEGIAADTGMRGLQSSARAVLRRMDAATRSST